MEAGVQGPLQSRLHTLCYLKAKRPEEAKEEEEETDEKELEEHSVVKKAC